MVAGLIRDGHSLADIGTDHAYLPCYLLQEGRIPSAAAADVGEGPLRNAAATLQKEGFEENVELLLCSGFSHPNLRQYQDFVMAGMGGNLIADLLAEAPFLKAPGIHLVLQPQSHAEDVRAWLCQNGFSILRERATRDNGRVYIALEAEYTGVQKDASLSDCFLGKLPECTDTERNEYLKTVLRRLTNRHDALLSYPEERDEVELLEPVMNDIQTLLNS